MKKFLTLTVIMIGLATIYSCKKNNESNPEPEIKTRSISGTIVLPSGMSTDLTGWKISSNFSETNPNGNNYQSTVSDDQVDIQYVTNGEGTEILMGITYPGQTDFTISAASSVLAILLKSPPTAMLTTEGQVNLINSLKANPKFQEAVESVNTAILSGKTLLDTTNTQMIQALGSLFDVAAMKTTAGNKNVTIMTTGKTILFQNPGKPFEQVVGIYKDGSRVQKLRLKRYEFFPKSMADIWLDTQPTEPIEETYTFPGDGEYDIRVCSGAEGTSPEAIEALTWNIVNIALDNIKHVCKWLPLDMNNGCLGKMTAITFEQAEKVAGSMPEKPLSGSKITRVGVELSSAAIELIKGAAECSSLPSTTFLDKTSKLFKFFDPVSNISSALNQSHFVYQFFKSAAEYNTCYKVVGNTLKGCGAVDVTFTPGSFELTSSAQTAPLQFTMSADSGWTATSDQSWLTLDKSNGTGSGTINLSVTENTSDALSRTAKVIVTVKGNMPETLKVVQQAKRIKLVLTPTVINASATGSVATVHIDIEPNMAWSAVSGSPGWLTITGPSSGTGDYDIVIDAKPNSGSNAAPRTGIIAVSVNGYSVNAQVTVNQAGNGSVPPSLSGIWTMDLTLGTGVCDETLLEDEAGIPPTFHFNTDGTITFDTDPVGSDLNEPEFTNTYTYSNGTLTIKSHLLDLPDENIRFDATLTWDQALGRFVGAYTNVWTDNTVCTNSLTVHK